ncbi:chromate transporter [Anaerorhabdus sp.]|uniref:chromate transporter n=1 Tax=Anaerorhabdus sp. TaxID=1872524 RepID=UPI002FCB4BC4
MKIYIDLFVSWFKMGLFTFGGGYAMLPMIQREVIDKHHWATEEEVMDYYAIGQCTPGIIAVNTATFVGYYQKGVLGGIVSTLGVITPSIIIISLIATVLSNFAEIVVVQNALAGIRVAVCYLMMTSIIKLWKSSIKDTIGVLIFVVAVVLSYFLDFSVVLIILLSALVGIVVCNMRRRKA